MLVCFSRAGTDSLTLTQENPCLKDRTTTCGECITVSTLCAFCTDAVSYSERERDTEREIQRER